MDSTTVFFQATKLRPAARLAYNLGSVDELMNYELINTKSWFVQFLPGTLTERAKRRDMSKDADQKGWISTKIQLWCSFILLIGWQNIACSAMDNLS